MKDNFKYLIPLAVGIALLCAIPLIFTIVSVIKSEPELWKRLYETRLKIIFPNTIKLLLSVSLLTLIIGVSTALIVTHYDFKGRKIWEWALILPLAIPGYILAYAYASIMAPGGIAEKLWSSIFKGIPTPSLYSFYGVSIILGLVNYPYVYLLARASFLNQNEVYSEAAKVMGVSKIKRIWAIKIKMAYPGIMAGLALALMEVMADFGTVTLLRYPTFTEAIYRQMTGRFDPSGAAALSFVLAVLAFLVLNIEKYFRGKRSFEQTKGFKANIPKKLNFKGTLAVNILMLFILSFAFIIPSLMLLNMSFKAIMKGTLDPKLVKLILNSLFVSALGATLAVILALPIAYLHARYTNRLTQTMYYVSTLGYSLPGPVIAVGILLTVSYFLKALYGSIVLLFLAYVIRFMPIAIQSQDSALSMISRTVEEASKSLGAGFFKTFKDILLPLMKKGIISGWIIVFVDCMKELPATMMLRPLAFDTLAIKVWVEASESLWDMAALPALLIVFSGISPLILVIRKTGFRNGIDIT